MNKCERTSNDYALHNRGASNARSRASQDVDISRVSSSGILTVLDSVALEEPLEIQLCSGPVNERSLKSISVTMRTPGADRELAIGFLYAEGVFDDSVIIENIVSIQPGTTLSQAGPVSRASIIRIDISPGSIIRSSALDRNFYITSSCGVCGKASLAALRSISPPRRVDKFVIDSNTIFSLAPSMRREQRTFEATGGLHAAALFDAAGELLLLREDIGRHNAVDKLIGASLCEDQLPLRDRILMLSGRISFELMQKAVIAGIPIIIAVGAPSSLAVQVAKEFDVTLIGFLREDHFNVYHGEKRVIMTHGQGSQYEA